MNELDKLSFSDLKEMLNYAEAKQSEAGAPPPSQGHTWEEDIKKIKSSIAYKYQMITRGAFGRY